MWQHISDGDIEALVSDEIFQPQIIWSLGDLQASYYVRVSLTKVIFLMAEFVIDS